MCQVRWVSRVDQSPLRMSTGGTQIGNNGKMFWDKDGHYRVISSGADDRIRVYERAMNPGRIAFPEATTRWLVVEINGEKFEIPLNGTLDAPAKSVTINAGAGNDHVSVDRNVRLPLTIIGGRGNDTLVGNAHDRFIRGPGHDQVFIRLGRCHVTLL